MNGKIQLLPKLPGLKRGKFNTKWLPQFNEVTRDNNTGIKSDNLKKAQL